ncbi:unnamed protein product [Ambrosiozyma monospora]|uniref:Unnamed protein product n=1 Tax=Ambrosiozyma monospora TaxID=43982 RepID=A0ACB5TGK8_AMBMO|nr:unnamed protein product [Ambrosiozyma monospora]
MDFFATTIAERTKPNQRQSVQEQNYMIHCYTRSPESLNVVLITDETVQQQLDDTKVVLQKSIQSMLERGEQLDSLVDKSETLSNSSKTFYKQAKKTNSCCVIM